MLFRSVKLHRYWLALAGVRYHHNDRRIAARQIGGRSSRSNYDARSIRNSTQAKQLFSSFKSLYRQSLFGRQAFERLAGGA